MKWAVEMICNGLQLHSPFLVLRGFKAQTRTVRSYTDVFKNRMLRKKYGLKRK
jgi:hypothetical protein